MELSRYFVSLWSKRLQTLFQDYGTPVILIRTTVGMLASWMSADCLL